MMALGTKSLTKGFDLIGELYDDNQEGIREAWKNAAQDETVTVSLSIKFSPNKKNFDVVDIDASIAYVKEKVKQTATAEVNEMQEELPFGETTMDFTLKDGNGLTTARVEGVTSEDLRRAPGAMNKPRHVYRLRNHKTKKWWEGTADDPSDALKKSGFPAEDCDNLRYQTEKGGWAIPKEVRP